MYVNIYTLTNNVTRYFNNFLESKGTYDSRNSARISKTVIQLQLEVVIMKIKRASEEDIKAVAKVYVDSWRTTYRGLVPNDYLDNLSYTDAEKKWEYFLNNENEPCIYIALNDLGKIIGFASGKSIDVEHFYGELFSLYLLQECRGLGIGRQLVSAIAKHFKKNNIDSMLVWVMKKNKSGVGFYERLGGKEYLRRKSEFGGMVVEDFAYGWKDVSVLVLEKE